MLNMVGLANVKERIGGIRNSLEVNERRSAAGGRAERPQNLCIMGNPGVYTELERIPKLLLTFFAGCPRRPSVKHRRVAVRVDGGDGAMDSWLIA
jgi:hypothetical protein